MIGAAREWNLLLEHVLVLGCSLFDDGFRKLDLGQGAPTD